MKDVQVSLTYYAQQACSPQWRGFVAEMVGEFYAQVEEDLARNFFARIGARLAQCLPLPACTSLEELEAALGRVLADMQWGWVRLREAGHHIQVTHGCYPIVPMYQNAPETWLVPVMEAAFTEWLNMVGGNPAFRAVLAEPPASPAAPMTFLYGSHT